MLTWKHFLELVGVGEDDQWDLAAHFSHPKGPHWYLTFLLPLRASEDCVDIRETRNTGKPRWLQRLSPWIVCNTNNTQTPPLAWADALVPPARIRLKTCDISFLLKFSILPCNHVPWKHELSPYPAHNHPSALAWAGDIASQLPHPQELESSSAVQSTARGHR